MIDWFNVFANAPWILGLAVSLVTFSLAHSLLTGLREKSLRQGMSEPSFRPVAAIGILIFALGFTLLVTPWWYKVTGVGIMALSLWQGFVAWRDGSGQPERS
jgi:hypothetical protein